MNILTITLKTTGAMMIAAMLLLSAACGGERKTESRADETKTAANVDTANVETTTAVQCDMSTVHGAWRHIYHVPIGREWSDGDATLMDMLVTKITILTDNTAYFSRYSYDPPSVGTAVHDGDCNYKLVFTSKYGADNYEPENWEINLRYQPHEEYTALLSLKAYDDDIEIFLRYDADVDMASETAKIRALAAEIATAMTPTQTPSSETFTDPRDNQTYRTVRIGNRTWFAQNLNYQTKNSWCYSDDNNNCEKYGRLYSWDAAMSACPAGWRLPTEAHGDWYFLLEAAGDGGDAGGKLKSRSGWYNNGNGTDDFGFTALPGGAKFRSVSNRGEISIYSDGLGEQGFWWGVSVWDDGSTSLHFVSITWNSNRLGDEDGQEHGHIGGISVRCVTD